MAEATIKLKNGTITRIELDELSKYFFPLATNIARKFAQRGREDDFISAGYFGIAHALLHAAEKMYDDDLESWVKSCIYRYVRRHFEQDHIICIPHTTFVEARRRGEPIAKLKSCPLSDQTFAPRKTTRYKELLEKLDGVAVQPLDAEILDLRLEGYTDQEIADKLGKSKSDIHRRRLRLEVRFNAAMENE